MTDANPSHVINTTDERFELDVIERSKVHPVVVDFWADWCQPCRMLAPILEKLAADHDGAFTLVKAATEQNEQAAAEFNVSSLPTVYGVVDGQPVDFFNGVLPQDQVATWIDRLLLAGKLNTARQMEETDVGAAEAIYLELIDQLPNEPAAKIGLARTLLLQGKAEDAEQQIEQLEDRGFLEPEAQKLKAQLNLQRKPMPNLDELRAAIEAQPSDFARRLELAEALAAGQQYEEALQTALAVVREDRKASGDRARELMVDIFHLLPDDSELTSKYRRQLATALY